MARTAFNTLSEKLAEDLVILDLRGVSLVADYFVIATATSTRHLRSLADSVREAVAEVGRKPDYSEGVPESGWLLVDYSDVVVHLFDEPRREYFDLEGVWSGAALVARMA